MVGPSDGRLVRPSVGNLFYYMSKMDNFLHENHQEGHTLTLLNVLNVLNMFNVLNVLNMPNDPSLACWALFFGKWIGENRVVNHFPVLHNSV